MYLLHKSLLILHVAVGSVALVVFWLPVFARKGSPFHKRAGRWFATAMYTVALSGLLMSTLSLIDPLGVRRVGADLGMIEAFDTARQVRTFSVFLLMLSTLVFVSVRHSVLVLRAKNDRSRLRRPVHVGSQVSLGVLGLIVGVVGVRSGELLLMIFSVLSVAGAAGMLRYSFKRSLTRNEWWIEHLGNIIGGGIGAYTAFFAFGGRELFGHLLSGNWQVVPWVLPSIIGVAFTVRLSRHYRAKFAPKKAVPANA